MNRWWREDLVSSRFPAKSVFVSLLIFSIPVKWGYQIQSCVHPSIFLTGRFSANSHRCLLCARQCGQNVAAPTVVHGLTRRSGGYCEGSAQWLPALPGRLVGGSGSGRPWSVLKNSQQSLTLKVALVEWRLGLSGAGELQVDEQKARGCGKREDRKDLDQVKECLAYGYYLLLF